MECAPIERSFTGCEKRFCCPRCFNGSGRATREKACERAELRPDGSQESGRRTSRTTTRFRSVLFLVREFKNSQLPPFLSYSTSILSAGQKPFVLISKGAKGSPPTGETMPSRTPRIVRAARYSQRTLVSCHNGEVEEAPESNSVIPSKEPDIEQMG